MEEKTEITQQSKTKKILKNVLLGVECAIIVLCVVFSVFVIVNNKNSVENGKTAKFFTVQSNSMKPVFEEGDLVLTKRKNAPGEAYDIGQIVVFRDQLTQDGATINYLNTHRIIGYVYVDADGVKRQIYEKDGIYSAEDFYNKFKNENYAIAEYITKGDNNLTEDAVRRSEDDILAVYNGRIKNLGGVIDKIKEPSLFFGLFVIPLILLFIYNVYGIVRIIIKTKVDKAKEETKLDEEEIKKRAIEEYLKAQNVSENSDPDKTQATPENTVEPADTGSDNTAKNGTETDAEN